MRRTLIILAVAGLAGCASRDQDYYGVSPYDDTGYSYDGQPYYASPGDYDYGVRQGYVQSGAYYYPGGYPYYARPYYYGGGYHHEHGDDHEHGDHDQGNHRNHGDPQHHGDPHNGGDHHTGGGHDDAHGPDRPSPGFVTRPDGTPAAPHGPAGASPRAPAHASGSGARGSPHGH